MRLLTIFLFLWSTIFCFSQENINLATKNINGNETKYEVLADQNYSLQDILTNKKLIFKKNDTIFLEKSAVYWLKIKIYNPTGSDLRSSVFIIPQMNNTIYEYDEVNKKWRSQKNGLVFPSKFTESGIFISKIPPKTEHIIYAKLDLNAVKKSKKFLIPYISIIPEPETENTQKNKMILGVSTLLGLFLFLLYSVLIYFLLKDRIYIYYHIILIGAIFYIGASFFYFNGIFNVTKFGIFIKPDGSYYYFTFNSLLKKLSIIVFLYGFVELSRMYLQTKLHQKRLDRVLKYLLTFYTIIILIDSFFSFSGIYFLEVKMVLFENVLIFLIILFICLAAFRSRKYNQKLAFYFILSNALPLITIVVFVINAIFFHNYSQGALLVLSVGVLSITLTFVFALVGRYNLMKDQMNAIEIESQKVKNEHEMMKLKLEMNQQKLISSTIYISQKNDLLTDLKEEIDEIYKKISLADKPVVNKLRSIIQSNLVFDSNWESFKIHFEEVHPNYFSDLLSKFPHLSQNELRLSAYLHLNLSNKEISALLKINPESVKKAKMRLKAKINL